MAQMVERSYIEPMVRTQPQIMELSHLKIRQYIYRIGYYSGESQVLYLNATDSICGTIAAAWSSPCEAANGWGRSLGDEICCMSLPCKLNPERDVPTRDAHSGCSPSSNTLSLVRWLRAKAFLILSTRDDKSSLQR